MPSEILVKNIYIFPTVKSALLLLFNLFPGILFNRGGGILHSKVLIFYALVVFAVIPKVDGTCTNFFPGLFPALSDFLFIFFQPLD